MVLHGRLCGRVERCQVILLKALIVILQRSGLFCIFTQLILPIHNVYTPYFQSNQAWRNNLMPSIISFSESPPNPIMTRLSMAFSTLCQNCRVGVIFPCVLLPILPYPILYFGFQCCWSAINGHLWS